VCVDAEAKTIKEAVMRKRFLFAAIGLSLLIAFSLSGCDVLMGKDGVIYGEYNHPVSFYYFSLGGFPMTYLSQYTYYQIAEGSYDVYYTLDTGSGYYYPGGVGGTGGTDPSYYWHSTYSVTANKGALFTDGQDKYFDLYLGYYGMSKSGDVKSIVNPTSKGPSIGSGIGTSTWTQGGLTITIKNEIVSLSAAQKAALAARTEK
jgi:hypothetical protein